jgi:pimeloyl-ACP methyl ester carboxylesterase
LSETSFIELSGGPVEYAWAGPVAVDAERPSIILLHEGLGSVDLWRDFPEKLAGETGCRVLTYSRYGYGRSAPCMLPRPARYMHDEALHVLPELLQILEIRRHILVGHSDGGSIALIHAGAAAQPGLAGMVTMAAHIFNEPINTVAITKAREAYDSGKLREALAKYHGVNTDCAFRGWSEAWLSDDFRQWNLEEFLPDIAIPSLIMQGENDEYGTIEQVNGIMRGLTCPKESLILPSCGHSPHRDQPEMTLAAIRRFAEPLL